MTPDLPDEAVEAAAKAICALENGKWDAANFNETSSGNEPEDQREGYREQARAALTAALSVTREKDGWQLIETAPKDGTRILGFDGFGLVVMEWWEPDADDKRDGCVATWVSFSGTGEEYIEPTHWMPLPSAPPPKAGT